MKHVKLNRLIYSITNNGKMLVNNGSGWSESALGASTILLALLEGQAQLTDDEAQTAEDDRLRRIIEEEVTRALRKREEIVFGNIVRVEGRPGLWEVVRCRDSAVKLRSIDGVILWTNVCNVSKI